MKESTLKNNVREFLELTDRRLRVQRRFYKPVVSALQSILDSDLENAIIDFRENHVRVVPEIPNEYGHIGYDWEDQHFICYEDIIKEINKKS